MIDDIDRRVHALAPQLPGAFYSDVTALSSSVGRLRRVARIACDAAQITAASPGPQQAAEIVTPTRHR